jgi:hypothetical protein
VNKAISEIDETMEQGLKRSLMDRLAVILAKVGQIKNAYEIFWKLTEVDVVRSQFEWDIILEEIKQGKIESLRKRIKNDYPGDEIYYFSRIANLQSGMEDFKGAEETLSLVVPTDDYGFSRMARAWAKAGNFTKADRAVDAIQSPHYRSEALADVAAEKFKKGDRVGANEGFISARQEALKLVYDQKDQSLYHISYCQSEVGDLIGAKVTLDLLPEYCLLKDIALFSYGKALFKAGEKQKAEQLLELFPPNDQMRKNLEMLLNPETDPVKRFSWSTKELKLEAETKPFTLSLKAEEEKIKKAFPYDFHKGNRSAAFAAVARRYMHAGLVDQGLRVLDLTELPNRKVENKAKLLVESLELFATGTYEKMYIKDY